MTNFNFAKLSLASVLTQASIINDQYTNAKAKVLEVKDAIFNTRMNDLLQNKVEECVVNKVYDTMNKYIFEAEAITHKIIVIGNRVVNEVEFILDNANNMSKDSVEKGIDKIKDMQAEVITLKSELMALRLASDKAFESLKRDFSHEKISFNKLEELYF